MNSIFESIKTHICCCFSNKNSNNNTSMSNPINSNENKTNIITQDAKNAKTKQDISLNKLKNKLVQPNQNLPNQNAKLKTLREILIEDLNNNQIKKATTINSNKAKSLDDASSNDYSQLSKSRSFDDEEFQASKNNKENQNRLSNSESSINSDDSNLDNYFVKQVFIDNNINKTSPKNNNKDFYIEESPIQTYTNITYKTKNQLNKYVVESANYFNNNEINTQNNIEMADAFKSFKEKAAIFSKDVTTKISTSTNSMKNRSSTIGGGEGLKKFTDKLQLDKIKETITNNKITNTIKDKTGIGKPSPKDEKQPKKSAISEPSFGTEVNKPRVSFPNESFIDDIESERPKY